jgi:oligopeptide/dipeptide ABC transporter ATP-binding protein
VAVRAVDGVGLTVRRGETMGLVGESGCGKSTLARLILRLLEPDRGEIVFDQVDITHLRGRALRRHRRRAQMIFQDPYASLNPRLTIRRILNEPLSAHGIPRGDRVERIEQLLSRVSLPTSALERYPHQFSGGQRQRIGIARALALAPDLIVADEPVAALDVSIQAQVLNLLKDLKRDGGQTMLFIAHDLSVVRFIADRIGVMYLGGIVELADTAALFATPLHPYSRLLLSAVPRPDPRRRSDVRVPTGDLPNPAEPPPGCPFHTRCPIAEARCRTVPPRLRQVAPGHHVACHAVTATTTDA